MNKYWRKNKNAKEFHFILSLSILFYYPRHFFLGEKLKNFISNNDSFVGDKIYTFLMGFFFDEIVQSLR